MNTVPMTTTVKPWSAQALIPRPVERKLTGLPKHRIEPLHDAKALKAVSHAVPLPPLTDYDNPAEPYVPYAFARPSETTEWCAMPLGMEHAWYYGEALPLCTSHQAYLFVNNTPVPAPEPPFVPFALLAPWSVTTELPAAGLNVTPLVKAAQRKDEQVLIKAKEPISPATGHAPLAYVKDEAEHARVMAAYDARIRGDEGAQDTWNAISAGSTLGLTVDESLRRFGRPVVLA